MNRLCAIVAAALLTATPALLVAQTSGQSSGHSETQATQPPDKTQQRLPGLLPGPKNGQTEATPGSAASGTGTGQPRATARPTTGNTTAPEKNMGSTPAPEKNEKSNN